MVTDADKDWCLAWRRGAGICGRTARRLDRERGIPLCEEHWAELHGPIAGRQGRTDAEIQRSAAGLLVLAFGCLWVALAWWWPEVIVSASAGAILVVILGPGGRRRYFAGGFRTGWRLHGLFSRGAGLAPGASRG